MPSILDLVYGLRVRDLVATICSLATICSVHERVPIARGDISRSCERGRISAMRKRCEKTCCLKTLFFSIVIARRSDWTIWSTSPSTLLVPGVAWKFPARDQIQRLGPYQGAEASSLQAIEKTEC